MASAPALIFLDIDGVICCNNRRQLEEPKLQQLKRICRATGASVVRVLDVGAGTGVLSMFAAAAAAEESLPIQVCRIIP